jgi:hypothetical protein
MGSELPLTLRLGAGVARAVSGESGISRGLEYEESGRVLRVWWDPRESGTVVPFKTDAWDIPPGAVPTEDERQRAREGIWAIARKVGAQAAIDESPDLPCRVAVGWKRSSGFLVNVHESGRIIEYLETRRTLVVRYRETASYHAVVTPPHDARWTYPAGVPIGPDAWRVIVERLAKATASDMWIGANLPWRITTGGA